MMPFNRTQDFGVTFFIIAGLAFSILSWFIPVILDVPRDMVLIDVDDLSKIALFFFCIFIVAIFSFFLALFSHRIFFVFCHKLKRTFASRR